jgi:hypothetical protein
VKAVAAVRAPSDGVTVDQLGLVITGPDHPLAAGLSGRVQTYRVLREMNWGAHLAPGAQVVATLAPSLEAAGDATVPDAHIPVNHQNSIIYGDRCAAFSFAFGQSSWARS